MDSIISVFMFFFAEVPDVIVDLLVRTSELELLEQPAKC